MEKTIYTKNLRLIIDKHYQGDVQLFADKIGYSCQWVYTILREREWVPMEMVRKIRATNKRIKVSDLYPL